jgi:glycosyltransferase involved in cell wall biosynthesis
VRVAVEDPVNRHTILHVMPDLSIGGGQTIVLQGVQHQDPTTLRTVVATLSTGPVNEMRAAFQRVGCHVAELGVRSDLEAVRRLCALMRSAEVDLVQTHTDADRKVAQMAALLCGIPVVGHLHAEWVHLGSKESPGSGLIARCRSRAKAAVRDAVERRVVRHYIAESTRVRDLFRPLVDAPITVLQQAVPIDRFDAARKGGARARLRAELGVAEDARVLLCVSRIVEGKGHADLVPVLAAARSDCPDVVLVIVGEGDLALDLTRKMAGAGLSDAVLSLGSREDVPDLMLAADVFVFPSYSEGFGMVALEAMAAGLPVVAYDLPPFREFMLPGKSALLVPTGDVSELADGVRALLVSQPLRQAMGALGAEHARTRFPADGVARVFTGVYTDVLREPRAERPRAIRTRRAA